MRYVSINSVPYGSTGAVMRQVSEERRALGDECWCLWGRGRAAENDHEFNYGSKLGLYLSVLQARLDGREGFHAKAATRRLLAKLDEIDPDIVHLHNLHGYHLNVEMLFAWLAAHKDVQVRWTLHDCWAFTGHCAHFQYVGCERWRDGSCDASCPQLASYPKTYAKGSCAWSYERKRACFTQLSPERMTLVTPSNWLAGLVGESFLRAYPVEVRHNQIDTSVFRPTTGTVRERYGIGSLCMVLGVASPWTDRKGLPDFVRLATELDPARFAIVLVGLSRKQIAQMPAGVVALERTDSPQELAELYSAADVFFNPTREDNYPTVNLEAEACGTPVVTYDTGGCAETVRLAGSCVVEGYDQARSAIEALLGARSARDDQAVHHPATGGQVE